MSEPRPFLEDGSQLGISREAFEEMDEDELRELMLQWFHQNFEDPVNGNALWDGETNEYVYLWGGPSDAQEQLWDKFGDIVSEALIDEVVREIQRDGIVDWAGGSNSPFYEHEEPPEPEEPPSLEIYSDEPSDRYGSPEEREARARAKGAIEELRRALERPRIIGIGHNRPPSDEAAEPDEIKEFHAALEELSGELAKPYPTIARVKRWATPLRALPEGRRRTALAAAAAAVFAEDFAGRILPFEATAAAHYADIVVARRHAGNPIEGFDALIAATALGAGASAATRDTAGFAGCGVTLIDPWTTA